MSTSRRVDTGPVVHENVGRHVAKWINLKNIMLIELEKQVLEGYRKGHLLCNM